MRLLLRFLAGQRVFHSRFGGVRKSSAILPSLQNFECRLENQERFLRNDKGRVVRLARECIFIIARPWINLVTDHEYWLRNRNKGNIPTFPNRQQWYGAELRNSSGYITHSWHLTGTLVHQLGPEQLLNAAVERDQTTFFELGRIQGPSTNASVHQLE